MARTVTVGYQTNLNKYFTSAQWAALEAGRRQAQKEFQKYCNIVWAGSTRPQIWIGATTRSDVWAITYSNGKIYISVNKKFASYWTDVNMWTNLFMHEMSHVLISMQHCSNPVGNGKQCVLTISGPRALIPCSRHTSVLQAKYGKPIIPPPEPDPEPEPEPVPTVLTLNLTSGNDTVTVYLKQRKYTIGSQTKNIDSNIKEVVVNAFSGNDVLYVRECDVFDGADTVTAEGGQLKLTGSDFETVHAYSDGGRSTLYDTNGNDDFKVVPEYSNLVSPNRYIRCKGFVSTECKISKAGQNIVRINSSDVIVNGECSVIGEVVGDRINWRINAG